MEYYKLEKALESTGIINFVNIINWWWTCNLISKIKVHLGVEVDDFKQITTLMDIFKMIKINAFLSPAWHKNDNIYKSIFAGSKSFLKHKFKNKQ